MRRFKRIVALVAVCVMAICGADKQKHLFEIHAISHLATANQSTVVVPEKSRTICNPSGTNCKTTTTPPVTSSTTSITNVVEATGLRYKIVCTMGWVGSNCSEMIDGDVYQAELQGNTMRVVVRRGGNQGKPMRVKYKVLDIRPI